MGRVLVGLIGVFAYLSVMAIGLGVPYFLITYTLNYNLNIIVTGIVSGIAVIGGCILGIVVTALIFSEGRSLLVDTRQEIEKLNVYRAQARAMLEEMDEVLQILTDIRDLLKSLGE